MNRTKFIWNLDRDKKIKIKEIREYSIVSDRLSGSDNCFVDAYGFFHGGVRIFAGCREECVAFIDSLTEIYKNKQDDMNDNC
jgi:hypothetical protein